MDSKAFSQAIRRSLPVKLGAETQGQEKRKRVLPTYLIVALVIAMNLWTADSIIDVFKNLVAGLADHWCC